MATEQWELLVASMGSFSGLVLFFMGVGCLIHVSCFYFDLKQSQFRNNLFISC